MNAATTSIGQQATISQVSGNVQLIREGFFLPAQVGTVLLPGDRIVSDNAAKAVIQFSGVNDALVIEKGAAATFNIEVVEMDQVPQWIATDMYGEGVYFDSQTAQPVAQNGFATNLYGLFGTDSSNSESTGYPVLETVAALGATIAIYSDNENNDSDSTETTTTSKLGGSNNTGSDSGEGTDMGSDTESGTDQPPEEPQPEPNPTRGIVDPIGEGLEGLGLESLLGTTEIASPMGTMGNQPLTDMLVTPL